ncbi:MAG: putative DNA-binding domain-containing protein [Methylovulum sp.]|uniref:HvfC family RiPP maturation protein n=1 Tax=Methylovulum sp. TaxID=1916980 RepID=UPI002622BE9E|nr:putative DNA-binding domain-containing protein [Methylovulum sp.]MDD2722518.1 putative DNA-binding domain-containing protein [Methylovulum sp.]MDD5123046.1 putative DNA-binding domain-containing protein [Methylovulum sp.]
MPNNPPNPMNVDFAAKQREFVAYVRDSGQNPPPADVPLPRIDMYRELLFNNIDNFLGSNFPVLRQLLDDGQWYAMARDFYARHTCTSPYFSEIPEEFIAYLQTERKNADDFPFMLELAHYEWVEMAVAIAKEEPLDTSSPQQVLGGHTLALSPLAWPLAYQYPVHKIAPNFLPTEAPAQPTFLIVYRNRQDEVHFLEITPITYRLLELLQDETPATAMDCLKQIVAEMQHPQPELVINGGLQILQDLVEKGIVSVVA